MKRINGIEVTATEFGYDGCHKFYLCDSEEGKRQLVELEYDLYPIEELPEAWAFSCPLRFILSGDLSRTYVPQCEPAEFEGWHIEPGIRRILDDIRDEQLEANEC